jgi:nicotinate dehydrogenase subunit A
MELLVNGARHEVTGVDGTPLLHVLRNVLGLKSAKLGCALEQCGACKVIVDGVPTYSCVAPVETFVGRRIETLEGLAEGRADADALHPVQRALFDANAAQCGYCLAGIAMAAKALFDADPRPSRDAIVRALDDHLCRCGAQPRILRALERLAGHE